MRRFFLGITGVLLTLSLTGCSVAAFLLSGCDSPDADLVIINDSGRAVYSITVEYKNCTETVQAANGTALLEPGQSYGLTLEDGADLVTVVLFGRYSRELGRGTVDFAEERMYLSLERNGDLTVLEEWPNG